MHPSTRTSVLIIIGFAILGGMVGGFVTTSTHPYAGLLSLTRWATVKLIYWIAAFAWSGFLAIYAFHIHTQKGYRLLNWPLKIQQFILNFAGGFLGWVVIAIWIWTPWFNDFSGWEKMILAIFSFISLTGYLPYTFIVKNWFPGHR